MIDANTRKLNLLFLLASKPRHLSRREIWEGVEAYRESYPAAYRDDGGEDARKDDAAFQRVFERDKDDLRTLGIEIETHDDAYRVYTEKSLGLTEPETAVVAQARHLWTNQTMSAAAILGAAKVGIDDDSEPTEIDEAELIPEFQGEEHFDVFRTAAEDRQAIRFTYRDSRGNDSVRELEPWGLLSWKDRWYVGGRDRTRDSERLFRLSRIVGSPALIGHPGVFTVSPDKTLHSLATFMIPPPPDKFATLLVSKDRAHQIRALAVHAEGHDDSTDVLRVGYWNESEFVAQLATLGDLVVVVEPESLREQVIEHLRGIVAATEGSK